MTNETERLIKEYRDLLRLSLRQVKIIGWPETDIGFTPWNEDYYVIIIGTYDSSSFGLLCAREDWGRTRFQKSFGVGYEESVEPYRVPASAGRFNRTSGGKGIYIDSPSGDSGAVAPITPTPAPPVTPDAAPPVAEPTPTPPPVGTGGARIQVKAAQQKREQKKRGSGQPAQGEMVLQDCWGST